MCHLSKKGERLQTLVSGFSYLRLFSRMKFCPKITKMNFNTLDVGLTGYEPEFFLEKDGKAAGIMPAHVEVLKDWMEFKPKLKLDIPSFKGQAVLVDSEVLRFGSPHTMTLG